MPTKVAIALPATSGTSYDVRIGAGVLDDLGASMRAIPALAVTKRALVITDSNVAPLYLPRAKSALNAVGLSVADICIPAGEEGKSIAAAEEIWLAMADMSLGRDCVVVALGGGVVGDLAGFAASTYMRGVPVVQVPTTLLAMADSSVGGKTAVNVGDTKNLVGTFFQPTFVCADTTTLETLPAREWQCGSAEVAKMAAIGDDDFFFWLCDAAPLLAGRDRDIAGQAVIKCVVHKANVVAQDVHETAGVRECLNYGHTFGHAIEACAGHGLLSHGVCVAEGMRFAAELACERTGASREFADAQASLLDALGLPPLDWGSETLRDVSVQSLMETMHRDKKARGGEIRFVLADDVGSWRTEICGDQEIRRMVHIWTGAKE